MDGHRGKHGRSAVLALAGAVLVVVSVGLLLRITNGIPEGRSAEVPPVDGGISTRAPEPDLVDDDGLCARADEGAAQARPYVVPGPRGTAPPPVPDLPGPADPPFDVLVCPAL